MSDAPYTVGKWAGLDNYQCILCPFATLSENEMLAHWAERHGGRQALVASKHVLIADKSGRVVAGPAIAPQPESEPVEVELTPEERVALQEPLSVVKQRSKRKEAHHGKTDVERAADHSPVSDPTPGGELG